jgi:hypothetical protein
MPPRRLQLLGIVLALYVFLYNPIFIAIGIGSIKILLLACLGYAALNPRVILLLLRFRNEAFFTIGLAVYAEGLALRSPGVVSDQAYLHAVWFIESIFISVVLVHAFRGVLTRYGWEALIVLTGSAAAMISLVLIWRPEWNLVVRTQLISQSLDPEKWWFRGFAIAESASFSYAIIQGLVVGICLWCVKRSKLYAVPLIPLLISIVFNARIGLVVVLISLLLLLASRRVSLRLVGMLILMGSVGLAVDSVVGFTSRNEYTIDWAAKAFDDTRQVLSGDLSSATYDNLFDKMLVVPSTLEGVLFGEPDFPGATSIQQVSDIGYVNELFVGGALYVAVLLGFLAYLYARIRRPSGHFYYPLLFVATMLVANIKWPSLFLPSGFFRMFGFVYVYTLLPRQPALPVPCRSGRCGDELLPALARPRVRRLRHRRHRVEAGRADSQGISSAGGWA